MPRDKTLSHEKVNRAIREEFLEKGYEGASVRSIGERAGMTSAGLYRHYPDKAAMFDSIVEPVINAIEQWAADHKKNAY
ncbi:MAG: TetR/AcrR family transcriptional regulator, partial [Saccharofermentans sp.]|nr:TetR/AcrR family transcriptional regulator [Saccharofermentans sp.]